MQLSQLFRKAGYCNHLAEKQVNVKTLDKRRQLSQLWIKTGNCHCPAEEQAAVAALQKSRCLSRFGGKN